MRVTEKGTPDLHVSSCVFQAGCFRGCRAVLGKGVVVLSWCFPRLGWGGEVSQNCRAQCEDSNKHTSHQHCIHEKGWRQDQGQNTNPCQQSDIQNPHHHGGAIPRFPNSCSFSSQLEIKPEVPQCQTSTAESSGERLEVPQSRKMERKLWQYQNTETERREEKTRATVPGR